MYNTGIQLGCKYCSYFRLLVIKKLFLNYIFLAPPAKAKKKYAESDEDMDDFDDEEYEEISCTL